MSKKSSKVLQGNEDFNGLTKAEPSLPANWYFDTEWYEQELKNIFYSTWIYFCHHSEFEKVGTYRKFIIGTQEIFLVKDDGGEIRGYYNTCWYCLAA